MTGRRSKLCESTQRTGLGFSPQLLGVKVDEQLSKLFAVEHPLRLSLFFKIFLVDQVGQMGWFPQWRRPRT